MKKSVASDRSDHIMRHLIHNERRGIESRIYLYIYVVKEHLFIHPLIFLPFPSPLSHLPQLSHPPPMEGGVDRGSFAKAAVAQSTGDWV